MTDGSHGGWRRRRRLALRLLLVLAVSAAGVELGMRWLLFGEGELARRLGARLRDPNVFAERWEDEFWRLRHALAGEPQASGQADPVVGWRSNVIGEGSFAHRRRERLGGRRPVLMYGDSFTHCATAEDDCWQGLLERSERGDELCLMNYGVGGYGLDQMLVLLRATIERWSERDPIVIVGILVDDDLDRCALTARQGPKPWFSIDGDGALVEHPPALVAPPPVEPPSPGIASYLGRWLVHGNDWLPEGWRDRLRGRSRHARATRRLCARLLEELRDELVARDLEHFVVLFHNRTRVLKPAPLDWRGTWLAGELERLGIPFVSSLPALDADARASGDPPSAYFLPMGEPGQGHLNARGNTVVFGALLEGLAGRYDGGGGSR